MSDIKNRVNRIIVDQLGVSPDEVTEESHLAESLGADSLDFVELWMYIEKEFNINIPDEEFEKITCVGQIYTYLEERLKG